MATTAVEKERKTLADREQIETHSRILLHSFSLLQIDKEVNEEYLQETIFPA